MRLLAVLLFFLPQLARAADWQLQREGANLSPVRATLKGDKLYYALPDIFQPLGGSVERDPITRQFVALLGGRRVQLDPVKPLFTIEMKTYVLTAMPLEKDKVAYLPLDFYEQALPVLTGETLAPDAARAVLTLKAVAARPQPVRDATTVPAAGKKVTIVLDAGHGGAEEGALGPTGLKEKEISLSLVLRLKTLLEKEAGLRVLLTRPDDRTIPLKDRPALANQEKAALFLSIHLNAAPGSDSHGSETYYLGRMSDNDATARLVAAENAGMVNDKDGLQLVLWDMAQNASLKDSAALAGAVQKQLNDLLATPDRGVKQAPFAVLKGARVPAVLVEVAFISNAQEEGKLKSGEFLDKAAGAIGTAIKNYLKLRGEVASAP